MAVARDHVDSTLDTQVASDDPFLSVSHLAPLVQHAVWAVSMQQRKTNFEVDNERLGCRVSALLLGRVWVEDRLSTDAARCRRGEIEQQGPSGARWHGRRCRRLKGHIIGVVIWLC
jgi:hypothetical protein